MKAAQSSEAPVPGPPDVRSPSRTTRLLTSWKLWTLALVLAVALIGVSLSIRAYQRYQALRYLDKNDCHYELTTDSEWITAWFGNWAKGFRSVESIRLNVVADESFLRISVFPETRQLSTVALIVILNGKGRLDTISARGIEALSQLSELESLSIGSGWFDDSQLAQLFSVDRPLTSVVVESGRAKQKTLEAISAFSELTSLKSWAAADDQCYRGLNPLPKLRTLMMADVGPEAARWLTQSTLLRDLTLWNTTLDPQIMDAILQLKQLESLSLCKCRNVNDEALARLADSPRLESLTLPPASITWASLETLRRIPNLKHITVDNGYISDSDLEAAVEGEWELTTLYFGCIP
jgi:hypothetical protein